MNLIYLNRPLTAKPTEPLPKRRDVPGSGQEEGLVHQMVLLYRVKEVAVVENLYDHNRADENALILC